jgi:hypothetical protein
MAPFEIQASPYDKILFKTFKRFQASHPSIAKVYTNFGKILINPGLWILVVLGGSISFEILGSNIPTGFHIAGLILGSASFLALIALVLDDSYRRYHRKMFSLQLTSDPGDPERTPSARRERERRKESKKKVDKTPNLDLEAAQSSKKPRLGPSKKHYENDYTGLASLMVENPEKAIVRRFALLNMKNLLYMQAELVELEDQLEKAVEYDKSFRDTRPYSRSWFWLQNAHVIQQMPGPEGIPSEDRDAENDIPLDDFSMEHSPHPAESSDVTDVERTFNTMKPSGPITGTPAHHRHSATVNLEDGRSITSDEARVDNPSIHSVESGGSLPPVNDRPLFQRNLIYEIRGKLEKYSKSTITLNISIIERR